METFYTEYVFYCIFSDLTKYVGDNIFKSENSNLCNLTLKTFEGLTNNLEMLKRNEVEFLSKYILSSTFVNSLFLLGKQICWKISALHSCFIFDLSILGHKQSSCTQKPFLCTQGVKAALAIISAEL